MDLKQLQYFVCAADEGSISAAARKLFMTQPPLSVQIQALEKELDCALFERGHHRLRLTDAGHALYQHAVTLISLSRVAEEDVRAIQSGNHGVLRLGMVSSVGSTPACEWLCGFAEHYPHIDYELFEANTYELLEKLRAHLLQIAIVRRPFPDDDDLCCVPLSTEPLIAFIPPAFYEPNIAPTWGTLARYPLILYRRWESIVRKKIEERSLTCAIHCLCDDARTAILLSERGMGVCIAPASATALVQSDTLHCIPLTADAIDSQIVLVTLAGCGQSGPAALFREYMQSLTQPPEKL